MTSKRNQETQLSLLKEQKTAISNSLKENSLDSIKATEAKLLADNMAVLEVAGKFHQLGFTEDGEVDLTDLPFEWEGLPENEIKKKVRIAKAMWCSASDVPYGIKNASSMVLGIIKSKAVEQSGAKTLNIESIHFPAPSLKDNSIDTDAIEVED